MPIYEYRCSSCGFQKDYLRKLADPVLKVCPECGRETFSKMLTSAGFQLKGSGWYATDFKNSKSTATSASAGKGDAKADTKADTKSDSKSDARSDSKSDTKPDSKSDSKPDSKTGAASSSAGACS
jgi:putative FmdB family regulatory protein